MYNSIWKNQINNQRNSYKVNKCRKDIETEILIYVTFDK